MGEADSQAAGKQSKPERQNTQRRIVCSSAGAIHAKDSLEQVVTKKIRKDAMRPQDNSPLKILSHHNFQCRYSDNLKLPTANRQKQSTSALAENMSSWEAEKGRFGSPSLPSGHPVRKNKHETPVSRQKVLIIFT